MKNENEILHELEEIFQYVANQAVYQTKTRLTDEVPTPVMSPEDFERYVLTEKMRFSELIWILHD